MLCGGFKEMLVSSVLSTFGVLALVLCNMVVAKLGYLLQGARPIYRDCLMSDRIMIKVGIKALYLNCR